MPRALRQRQHHTDPDRRHAGRRPRVHAAHPALVESLTSRLQALRICAGESFYGKFDGEPQPNPDEIEDWKWVDVAELLADLESNAHDYTPWFELSVRRVVENLPVG